MSKELAARLYRETAISIYYENEAPPTENLRQAWLDGEAFAKGLAQEPPVTVIGKRLCVTLPL